VLRPTDGTRRLALVAPPVGHDPLPGGSVYSGPGGGPGLVICPIVGRLAETTPSAPGSGALSVVVAAASAATLVVTPVIGGLLEG